MKKILSTIVMIVCMAMNALAIDVVVDGIKYEIISTEDLTARVKGYADAEFANVVIPEYIEYYGRQFKVTEIADRAFGGQKDNLRNLQRINLPASLLKIGSYAFGWSNIEELEVPDAVSETGSHLVYGCKNLRRVVLGRAMTLVPNYSIHGSNAIDHIFLPNNIQSVHIGGITSSTIKDFIIEDTDTPISAKHTEKCDIVLQDGTIGYFVSNTSYCLFAACTIKNMYMGRNLPENTLSSDKVIRLFLPQVESLTVGSKVTKIKGLFNLDYMQRIKLMTSTPPAFDRGLATEECYMRVKVYVPKGSLNAYKNHAEWGKYWNIEEYDDACEAPEISYEDGMLKVTPVTSGSICYYTISDEDIVTDKEMTGGIKLSGTYNIEAYAMLNGSKSGRSYATLCWFDNTFTSDGITQTLSDTKRPVIVKSVNGQISVEGVENNEVIDLYTIDGKHIERTLANGNHASFNSMLQTGQALILRAGNNSVKFVVR